MGNMLNPAGDSWNMLRNTLVASLEGCGSCDIYQFLFGIAKGMLLQEGTSWDLRAARYVGGAHSPS